MRNSLCSDKILIFAHPSSLTSVTHKKMSLLTILSIPQAVFHNHTRVCCYGSWTPLLEPIWVTVNPKPRKKIVQPNPDSAVVTEGGSKAQISLISECCQSHTLLTAVAVGIGEGLEVEDKDVLTIVGQDSCHHGCRVRTRSQRSQSCRALSPGL